MKLIQIWLFVLISGCLSAEDGPLVTTTLGKIRGHYKTSFDGKKFAAFEGIRYARPPVDLLRFKDPQPALSWFGVWDATKRYECIQINTMSMLNNPRVDGEEDCLYINVYVPKETPVPNEKLDVIVHIHGGAFFLGSGHAYVEPDYLMDKNVILVTFNYRLGMFGFLSTGDKALPGNYGLKDQTLALKWIQQHIASFGGNPDSVTVTGTSAGAGCVHFHYISPWSKGLFQRGTAQSGSAINHWAIDRKPEIKAKLLASSVGCPDDDSHQLVECLQTRPAAQLIDRQSLFYEYPNVPLAPFAPVIDDFSPNPFVPKNPYFLLSQGKLSNDVPLILSNVQDEGLPYSMMYIQQLENLNTDWEAIAPVLFGYNFTLSKSMWKLTAREMKEQFLGDKDVSMETLKEFTQLLSERFFTYDLETAARLQAKVAKSPVYYYSLHYESSANPLKAAINFHSVPHGGDIPYIYTNKISANPNTKMSEEDMKMTDLFLNFLVSFAKDGVPRVDQVEWKPTGYKKLTLLNISAPDDVRLETVDGLSSRAFWKQMGFLENQNLVIAKDEL